MSHPPQLIRFCKSKDGTRIAYAICGSGPPLVWAQYWLHHLEFDWSNPVWSPWLSMLTRHHTLIRYDVRGCGLSDRDGVEFTIEKLVDDLEAVVDASRLEHFACFGMAGGSTAGIIYAVRHPERIKRLVLYAPYTRNRLVGSPTTEKIDEVKARLKVMELGWDNQTPAYSHFFTSLHLPDSSAQQFNSLNELLRVTTSPVNLTGLLNALFMADVHDLLPKIQCPTLVLHSRGNSIIPFDEGRKAASLIPGARFVPIESRNHLVLDNEPGWETLVQAINEFFSCPQEGLLLDELTPREREVLELVAQGLTNQDIARSLKISDKTVRNQVSQILNKMGVKSRAQAVARARDIGYGHRFFAELSRN